MGLEYLRSGCREWAFEAVEVSEKQRMWLEWRDSKEMPVSLDCTMGKRSWLSRARSGCWKWWRIKYIYCATCFLCVSNLFAAKVILTGTCSLMNWLLSVNAQKDPRLVLMQRLNYIKSDAIFPVKNAFDHNGSNVCNINSSEFDPKCSTLQFMGTLNQSQTRINSVH